MIAHRAMDQVRGFVALVAPWVAMPGDSRMHPLVVIAVVLLLLIGAATVGYGGLLEIRQLLPPQAREAPQ